MEILLLEIKLCYKIWSICLWSLVKSLMWNFHCSSMVLPLWSLFHRVEYEWKQTSPWTGPTSHFSYLWKAKTRTNDQRYLMVFVKRRLILTKVAKNSSIRFFFTRISGKIGIYGNVSQPSFRCLRILQFSIDFDFVELLSHYIIVNLLLKYPKTN